MVRSTFVIHGTQGISAEDPLAHQMTFLIVVTHISTPHGPQLVLPQLGLVWLGLAKRGLTKKGQAKPSHSQTSRLVDG